MKTQINGLRATDSGSQSLTPELNPDTQKLVADFAQALAEKLYKAQLKYGYSANWKNGDWQAGCLKHFHQHIGKGDPRDVAAYCAFMWFHGWSTELPAPSIPEPLAWIYEDELPENYPYDAMFPYSKIDVVRMFPVFAPSAPSIQAAVPNGYVLVPIEPTEEMMLHNSECKHHAWDDPDCPMRETRRLVWAHMIAAAPQASIPGKVFEVSLPDSSSKAFWSGSGKSETFHPETYKRWVKEAIERACAIAGISVVVK